MHKNSAERFARRVLPVAVAWLVACCAGPGICIGASIEQEIEKMAADNNKDLPKQLDPITRLDRIEPGPGKAYSYIYTLGKALTDSQKQEVRERTTRLALATPAMQPMFKAGVTVWYKYFDAAGNKMLEFAVRGTPEPEKDVAYKTAYRSGYLIGAFIGGLIVGLLCGSLPLYLGIRRGRSKLAIAAMVTCAAAGLVLGLLLAAPAALVFTIVILAMPRVVPESTVVQAQVIE